MTYKDIILKLLKSREDLICIEDHLMNDFRENGNSNISFSDWCSKNQIVCRRVHEEKPPKLHLKRSGMLMNMT
ncbi:MAG: hypothetical protein K0B09_06630 [Bacteroidales bacterium]|nr:hypothetical protein [Bacteroidales bacterium]